MDTNESTAPITAKQSADELLGTCKSLYDVVKNGEDDNIEFCRQIDDIVARCNTCGWWVEAGEVDENGDCEGCATIEDEDDGDGD